MTARRGRVVALPRDAGGDRGNAVVQFVMVVPMLIGLGVAVFQVAMVAHVATVTRAAATEAARVAALSQSPAAAAHRVAEDMLARSVAGVSVDAVTIRSQMRSGRSVIHCEVSVAVRVAGLADLPLQMHGYALAEPW